MGSGSSRSGRIPRRRRSPDRRQTGPGETASEGGAADQAPTAAVQEESGCDPRPATSPGGREETLRLLDQLLAESEAWGPQERTPRGPARLPPAVSVGAGPSTHPSASLVCSHPGLRPYLAPLSPAHPECPPQSLIGFCAPSLPPLLHILTLPPGWVPTTVSISG